jgi:hypothetical protein
MLSFLIAAIQVADVVIHAAIGQLEPVRVAANLIVLAWLVAGALGRLTSTRWTLGVLAAYLALNGFFVAEAGITNPAQGGQLRVTLVLLVLATAGLLGLLSRKQPEK